MGGGREEGLVKEGGAVGVPSAQAPRGARMLGCETRNLYDKQMGTRGEIYTGHGK